MKIIIKTAVAFFLSLLVSDLKSQTAHLINTDDQFNTTRMIEIRSYNLKPGTRNEFHKLILEQALPLLRKWKIEVVAYGPSIHDSDSYFLVRSYKNLHDMQQSKEAFYMSDDWKKGPREPILASIENDTTIVLPADVADNLSNKILNMETATPEKKDSQILCELNAQFIKNFINQDVRAQGQIIHKNFICIESDGSIVDRETYLKNWATDYANSGYASFSYGDEQVRIFGSVALVLSKTTYTKMLDGKNITGHSLYTDTYFKENGQWLCVQAQITSVKSR